MAFIAFFSATRILVNYPTLYAINKSNDHNVIGYKILGEKMDDPLTFYKFGKVIESVQGNSLLSNQHNIKSNEVIKDAILFLIFTARIINKLLTYSH